MVRAKPRARVSVKILEEHDQVPPVWIILEDRSVSVDWPAPVTPEEDSRQSLGHLRAGLPQRLFLFRPRGKFHFEFGAVVIVNPLQRLDQQEIHWKPDRAAPIGISSE